MLPTRLALDAHTLGAFCRRWHVRRLGFFGSVLREDFRPDSDVDVLIEFAPGQTPGWSVIDAEQELSELCGGRAIDLVNPRYIHPRLRAEILATAEWAYGEG